MSRLKDGSLLTYLIIGLVSIAGIYYFVDRCFVLTNEPYRGVIEGKDDSFYFYWLHSVMVDGDLDFSNQLENLDTLTLEDRERILADYPRTEKGLISNEYPVGWALFSAPWYIMAALAVSALNLVGMNIPYDGSGSVYQLFIYLGQFFYACLGLWFSYAIIRKLFSGRWVAAAVFLSWGSSFMLFYAMRKPSMAHNVTFFCLCTLYYLVLKLKENPEKKSLWAMIGAFCALLIQCRLQAGIYLLYPLAVETALLLKDNKQMKHVLLSALSFAVAIFPQLLAWKLLYGNWLVYSYNDEGFIYYAAPKVFEVLFSPFHGLYYWHPILLLFTLGFLVWAVRFREQFRIEAVVWPLIFILVLYMNSSWHCWWFGASFGARAFDGCILFLMLGAAVIFEYCSGRPKLFYPFVAIGLFCVLFNINLIHLAIKSRLISLEVPVTYSEICTASKKFWIEGEKQ